MGRADHLDYREITKLKLSKEHFPFPCTLQPLVLQRYADQDKSAAPGQEMDAGELLAYLRNTADSDQPPLEAILAQTEEIGDPALPTAAQVSALRWLTASWEAWEEAFPLEEPLAAELRRLRHLLAIAAVTDFDFHTPGEHPLHRILDTLQEAAVGWHPQLDRAGQVVSKLVSTAVADCLATLEGGDVTLEQVASEVERAAARNSQRVTRMAQRMAQGEQGRARSVQARQRAAAMLNDLFQRLPATAEIGTFLRGPWYDSAQLAWLKFGEDSPQWQQFCDTTSGLLESLQNLKAGDEPGRQALMQRINSLPDELRRWALSLQNDSSALEDMLARLEFDHLRLMRFQQLDLVTVPPIDSGGGAAGDGNMDLPLGFEAGEWFLVSQGKKRLRMQLVARDPESGDLLFANCAGLKAGTRPEMEFNTELTTGDVLVLESGASFSRTLATTVGIDTPEALQNLSGKEVAAGDPAAGGPAPTDEAATAPAPQPVAAAEPEPIEPASSAPVDKSVFDDIVAEAPPLDEPETTPAADAASQPEPQPATFQLEEDSGPDLSELAAQLESDPAPEAASAPKKEPQQASTRAAFVASTPAGENLIPDLPTGTWMGFHDGDTPLLAKLAMHDRQRGLYIFTNREGIKLRQLHSDEFLDLIEQGLVDVMESRVNFRDLVKKKQKQLGE